MLRFKLILKFGVAAILVCSVAAGTMVFAQQKAKPTPAFLPTKSQITFDIMSFGMNEPEWRDALNADLHFVDQIDNGTLWTLAGRDEINRVLAIAQGAFYLPKPTAFEGEPFRVDDEAQTNYVSNLEVIRGEDGGVAFKPRIKLLSDGRRVELRGIERPDGILVNGTLELRQILGFTIRHITAEGLNTTGKLAKLRGQIQVPDFRIDKVEGEWLIPTDGALLVSLGVRPGKKNLLGFGTSPSEHLFLIKARRITEAEIAGAKLPAGVRPNAN